MKVINDKMYIKRGESVTYKANIKDKTTGSPMMIDEGINNPYFEFIVRPEVFRKDGDLCFRYYVDVTDDELYHKFKFPDPNDIVTYDDGNPDPEEHNSSWKNDYVVAEDDRYKLFKRVREVNHITYVYYAYRNEANTEWITYDSLTITIPMPHFDTAPLDGKTYKYEINLVGGNKKDNPLPGECPIVVDTVIPIIGPEDFIVGSTLRDG